MPKNQSKTFNITMARRGEKTKESIAKAQKSKAYQAMDKMLAAGFVPETISQRRPNHATIRFTC